MIKIIMSINSFLISTTPRTGSMWLYNVTREILKLSKINVLPIKVPKSDQEFFEIFEKRSLIDKVKKTYQVSLIMKFILKVWKRPIMRHMINLLIKRILIIYKINSKY